MTQLGDRPSLLNDALNRIGAKLQLDKTRYERANQSYVAATKVLEASDSVFGKNEIVVFPQGSFAIQTTVKPLAEEEYDLDFVVAVTLDWRSLPTPLYLLDRLYDVFRSDGQYSAMCEKKTRCVRLNYAGEFHLDILPACPNAEIAGSYLKIPDRTTKSWTDSNPQGFAAWFEGQVASRRLVERVAMAEPIPADIGYDEKPPLKIAVQILKRHRDVYFTELEDLMPRSIVITTLAGMFYQGAVDPYDAVLEILNGIHSFLNQASGIARIPNPAGMPGSEENLADGWISNAAAYERYKTYVAEFLGIWKKLPNEPSLLRPLEQMFGESVSRLVLEEQRAYLSRQTSTGQKRIPIQIVAPPKPWTNG